MNPESLCDSFKHNFYKVADGIIHLSKLKKNLPLQATNLLALLDEEPTEEEELENLPGKNLEQLIKVKTNT